MRKFGTNKKNPNPPWPGEQQKIIIPPGSSAAAIGMNPGDVQIMSGERVEASDTGTGSMVTSERNIRMEPIMGNMQNDQTLRNRRNNYFMQTENRMCGNWSVTNFLCNQTGKYVKLEFLFGENMHMEKTGRLNNVGKDFVAITENGTNNIIVCSISKIKFINIYEFGQ